MESSVMKRGISWGISFQMHVESVNHLFAFLSLDPQDTPQQAQIIHDSHPFVYQTRANARRPVVALKSCFLFSVYLLTLHDMSPAGSARRPLQSPHTHNVPHACIKIHHICIPH